MPGITLTQFTLTFTHTPVSVNEKIHVCIRCINHLHDIMRVILCVIHSVCLLCMRGTNVTVRSRHVTSHSQTTTHMHGHHEATMGLAGVSLGCELRALALSHTAPVLRGTA